MTILKQKLAKERVKKAENDQATKQRESTYQARYDAFMSRKEEEEKKDSAEVKATQRLSGALQQSAPDSKFASEIVNNLNNLQGLQTVY